jgi:LmbE family N-acetylglucosaminyl deacetylase
VPNTPDIPNSTNASLCETLLSSKRALFVGAHPDDIEFRAGGLVYLMRRRGVEVIFAIATRGGKRLRWPLNRWLQRIRTRNQMRAARILGGAGVIFYDYPDGALPRFIEPFTQDLRSLIEQREPDVVLCWDPEFVSHPHPDHKAAADATSEAVCFDKLSMLSVTTCFYGAPEPNLWVGLDDEALRAKIRALKSHRTETPWPYFEWRGMKWLLSWMEDEGAKIGTEYAESFRLRLTPPHPPASP